MKSAARTSDRKKRTSRNAGGGTTGDAGSRSRDVISARARSGGGRMLVALLGAMFLGNVDVAVTNTAMPAIRADLGASGGQLELVVSGYTLAYAATLVTCARLGRERGYRRMYLIGLVVFTLTSVGCGVAPGAWSLVVMRVFQGAAASLMISQVLTGIQLHYTGRARTRALGWYAAVLAGSAVFGQLLGGVIVSADLFGGSWRPVFLVNLPVGVLVLILSVTALPKEAGFDTVDADPVGVSSLSAALILIVVPLVFGREQGWPVWTWVSLAAGMALMVLFVRAESGLRRRGRRVLIDTRVLANPRVSWGLISAVMSTGTYFAILFVLALYLQDGLGKSAAFSGAALIPWVAAFGVAGPLLGRSPAPIQRYAATAGGLLMALALAAIAIHVLQNQDGTTGTIILLGVGGLGFGAAFSGTLTQITSAVTADHAAEISGLFNTSIRIGGMIGVSIFGSLYFGLTGPGPKQAGHGFAVTAAAMAATVAVAAGCSFCAAVLRTEAGR